MSYAWSPPSAPTRRDLGHFNYKIVEVGIVNKNGKLTDCTGQLLAVGMVVGLARNYSCCYPGNAGHRDGVVKVLHESGDWGGTASVEWPTGKTCKVPDSALVIKLRSKPAVDPVELQTFAIYLVNQWHLPVPVTQIPDVVARYVVARDGVAS